MLVWNGSRPDAGNDFLACFEGFVFVRKTEFRGRLTDPGARLAFQPDDLLRWVDCHDRKQGIPVRTGKRNPRVCLVNFWWVAFVFELVAKPVVGSRVDGQIRNAMLINQTIDVRVAVDGQ